MTETGMPETIVEIKKWLQKFILLKMQELLIETIRFGALTVGKQNGNL
jgi:hypothetical protein